MRVIARHRTAPLVVLDDDANTIIDTEDLEVIGSGAPDEGPDWELFPEDVEVDPRWEEIASADTARLDVDKRPIVAAGARTYRAPKYVRNALLATGLINDASRGEALLTEHLEELADDESAPQVARDWAGELLGRETSSPEDDLEEAALFEAAKDELDYDEIDAAMDESSIVAAGEAPESVDADANGIPDITDAVKIVYLAEIEEADTRAVQDLFAVTTSTAGAANVYKFDKGGWLEDPDFLSKLRSPTPPPIKQLDDSLTATVISQINNTDEEQDPEEAVAASGFDLPAASFLWGPNNRDVLSIIAAGGADRNRGNAETLRHYWSVGKGAAKIRWNTPGDMTRCMRQLRKYLGPRAAGYCALRHKELTGMWPGDRANIGVR